VLPTETAQFQPLTRRGGNYLTPADTGSELHEDEKLLVLPLRAVRALYEGSDDLARASLVEAWIDQSQRWELVPVRVDAQKGTRGTLTL
jgi:starvation-inducible DNA-binding protein